MTTEEKTDEKCRSCKWRDDLTGICFNGYSPRVAETTSDLDTCDFWKGWNMSKTDAIKAIQNKRECDLRNSRENCSKECRACDLLIDPDEIIESYELAIDALKKQIPFRPKNRTAFAGIIVGNCPSCGHETNIDRDFCSKCGQKLLWDTDAG